MINLFKIKYWFILLFLVSCQPEELISGDVATIIFYKNSTAGSYSVIINNINYGEVPYVDRTPACNTSEGLRLRFDPGTYYVDIRNNSNPVYVAPVAITLSRGECKLYRVQ